MSTIHQTKFLVFDGIDGSGKSSILRRVAEFLRGERKEVIETNEPTHESQVGKRIHALLRSGEQIDPMELQKLFVEDRKEHVKKIGEWLNADKWVFCDRYFYSSIAFGAADGAPWDKLVELNKDFLRPKFAFIFDVPESEAMRRIEGRGGEKEKFEKEKTLARVRENFLKLSREKIFPEIVVIDGSPAIQEVTEAVLNFIEP